MKSLNTVAVIRELKYKLIIPLFCYPLTTNNKNNFRYTTTVRISEQQPYQVREYVWCFNFPPRCSKYKIMFKTVYKTQNLVKERPVEDCCKGYTKSNTEDRCIPICSTDCLHGTCIAPDKCQCETGYGGPYCDISESFLTLYLLFIYSDM